ncbi:MAG: pyridoxamine 5'-phosphate oxidase family protein [Pseudomonadota bacterium]
MDVVEHWDEVKNLFKASFRSSMHFAIASVNEQNQPHVTPIGSLILGEPGRGFYFEEFTRNLPKNIETNNEVCVLAVNSSRWFWLKSLIGGRFETRPAVRLYGKAGQLREATNTERELFLKRVKSVRFSKGHEILWQRMARVRELEFSRIEPVLLGQMTPFGVSGLTSTSA